MAKSTADTISELSQAPQKNESTTLKEVVYSNQPIIGEPLTEVQARIFLLSNDKRMGTVDLDVEEDVIDPATGKQRRMRLLRGAQSVWFDEQPPSVFPPSYVNKNTLTLQFDRGRCIIPVNEPLKLQAAELTNRNVAVKKKNGAKAKIKDIYFYEWNPAEINAQAVKDENQVIRAMQLAMTTKDEEMVPHASYLGIPTEDEQGVPFDMGALKAAYIRVAKNNAEKFLNSIHSPTVKIAYMVTNAILSGKIDLGKQPGAAYWVDGGFITALPEGQDAKKYLVEFASLMGEENTKFVNQLRELSN